MTLKKKIIISTILILISIITWVIGWPLEWLSQLFIEGFFYFNFYYWLTHVNSLRRSRDQKILYAIMELGAFGFLLKIIQWIMWLNCWCLIEVFTFPVEYFEYLLFFIFIWFYWYQYFKNSNIYEKIIWLVILCAIFTYYNWHEITYQFNEAVYITRYPWNPDVDSHNTYSYYKTKDGIFNSVIYTEKLDWVDVDTFIWLSSLYAKDKNHVYFLAKILEGADSSTFEMINTKDDYSYSVDKKFTDGSSGGAYFKNWYAKDNNHVYFYGKIIDWVDLNSFQIVWDWYSKDKDHLYYNWKIVKTADPASFKIISDQFQQDKDNYYFEWKIWNINVDGPVKIP